MISNHSKLSIIEDIGNVLPSDRVVDRARLGVFCDHNCSPDELSFRSLVQIPSTTTTYNGKPFPTSLPISHLYHPPCFHSPLYTFHPLATLGARQLSLRDFKPQHPTFVGEMYREEQSLSTRFAWWRSRCNIFAARLLSYGKRRMII